MRTTPAYTTRVSDEGIELDEPKELAEEPPKTSPPAAAGIGAAARSRGRGSVAKGRLPAHSSAARRFDPPQFTFDDIKLATAPDRRPVVQQEPLATGSLARGREGGQLVAWLTVVFGVMVSLAGLGLLGWSIAEGRPHIWNLALGLTLGGQGALIFGLVLVVARLWRSSRHAIGRLQAVNAQLAQLQQTAEELAAQRGGAASFYADLARSTSPQMMLANLRGQLDQLSTRL